MKYKFEWDEEKNKANQLKHDLSFEDSVTVFDDENAVTLLMKNIPVMKIVLI